MLQALKNTYHLGIAMLAVIANGYPARKLTVIGVTGTDGKTTTSTMITQILAAASKKVGLVGTLGATINGEHQEIGLHVTTPSSFVLQKLLKQMVAQGCEYAIIEATSHGLDQNRLFGCNFSYALLTNITHEHLDYHKNFVNYVQSKAKLFKTVSTSVINRDGSWFDAFMLEKPAGKLITYGLTPKAQVNPQTFHFTLQIAGAYNYQNALGAVAMTKALGIADDVIRNTLCDFKGLEGRMEEVKEGQEFRVIVDFAHTPYAIEQVLSTLKNRTIGKLIAVFGSAGLRDKTKRPISGEAGTKFADITILTADDPATENVNDIIDQMVPGCITAGAKEIYRRDLDASEKFSGHVFVRIPDRKEAINLSIKIAQTKDTVALLGKGHQKSLSVGKEELPWDEKEIATEAIKNRLLV